MSMWCMYDPQCSDGYRILGPGHHIIIPRVQKVSIPVFWYPYVVMAGPKKRGVFRRILNLQQIEINVGQDIEGILVTLRGV